jgi:hypothetical protein
MRPERWSFGQISLRPSSTAAGSPFRGPWSAQRQHVRARRSARPRGQRRSALLSGSASLRAPNDGPRRPTQRTARFCASESFPVHSAHVGQELEVHYRWHPYFGCRVNVRRVEQRATGQFLKVLGPTGLVVSIAGWMLDPMVCGGMAIGRPRVELAALIELNRLLRGAPNPAHSRIDDAVIREKGSETSQITGSGTLTSADDPFVRQQKTRRVGSPRARQSRSGPRSDPDAGGWSKGGGAR